jgi:hypothetical protein
VRAFPQRDGKFQEIQDPNQTDLEFEVFINCWLLLAAEITLRIADLQLTLKGPDGSTKVGERVNGDLKNWQLREGRGSEEESDWSQGTIRKAPAGLPELDAASPLEVWRPPRGLVTLSNSEHHSFGVEKWIASFFVQGFFSHMHEAVASNVL